MICYKRYAIPLMTAMGISAAALAFPTGYFSPSSSLSQGKWVKISVDSAGVYRMPFDSLRALGFEAPERVRVFGRGAWRDQDQLTDGKGHPVVDADVTPLPCMNRDEALLFYAVGPHRQNVVENTESVDNSHFIRAPKHVWSSRGYYLLSDAVEGCEIETQTTEPSNVAPSVPDFVLAYQTHDFDMTHGFNACGQRYFGEKMTNSQRNMSWVLHVPAVLPHSRMVIEADAFADQYAQNNSFTLSMTGLKQKYQFPKYKAATLEDCISSPFVSLMDGYHGELRLAIEGNDAVQDAYLDYWTATYRAATDRAVAEVPDMAVPVCAGECARMPVPFAYADNMVWNIASPLSPVAVPICEEDGQYWFDVARAEGESLPRPLIFHPLNDTRMPRVEGEVAHTDLHARAAQGADLLIITVPTLHDQAQRLATLHEEKDGMSVMVANVGDIYNEYNGGTPSIMAYKALTRQLHSVYPGRVLNVLLFGPIRSESMGLFGELDHDSFIIGYQAETFTGDGEAHNVNDFIGMLDDFIDTKIEYATIHAGVGVLPCLSRQDADHVISKIERYMDEQNYDMVANKMLGMAGTGDSQMHTKQCKSLSTSINTFFGRSLLFSPMIADAFQKAEIMDHTIEMINSDFPLVYYLGHGTSFSLNAAAPLLEKGSIGMMRNNILPFFLFATCDITNFDRGGRGLSESLLFDTDDGIIGGLMSTRKAYSTQNEAMMRLFTQYLVQPKSGTASVRRVKTLGQAFAEAKTQLRTQHENTFQLVGDPSLRLALPVLATVPDDAADIVITPGRITTLTGTITTRDGQPVTDFNGRISAKVMAPSESTTCPNYVTGDAVHEEIVYADRVVSTSFGTVQDGRFTIEIEAPQSHYLRQNVITSIALSAYDKDSRTAASSKHVARVEIAQESDPQLDDTDAPVVSELRYDEATHSISFVVTDNRSIHLDQYSLQEGLTLSVDGERFGRLANTVQVEPGSPVTVSGTVPWTPLGPGNHVLMLSATDYAGNTTVHTNEFRIGEDYRRCVLTASSTAVTDEINFTVENSLTPHVQGRLIIADASGARCMEIPFAGTDIHTTLQNEHGVRLPAGRYSAWVICEAPGYEWSPAVHFAVVR